MSDTVYTLLTMLAALLWLQIIIHMAIKKVPDFTERDSKQSRYYTWIFLFGFFFLAILIGLTGFFEAHPKQCPRAPFAAFIFTLAVYVLFRTKRFHQIFLVMPNQWLLLWVFVRVMGVKFLCDVEQGKLPEAFAGTLGWGDLIFGATAPFVALWYRQKWFQHRAIAQFWSLIGIAHIIVCGTIGFLTQSSPWRHVVYEQAKDGDFTPTIDIVTMFPYVLNPIFGLPLLAAVQIITLWFLFMESYLQAEPKDTRIGGIQALYLSYFHQDQ